MTIASCTCDQKLVRLFRSLYGSNSIGKDHFLQIGASVPFENARNAKNENQGVYRVYPISLGVDIANQTSTARRTGFKLLFQAPSSFPSKQYGLFLYSLHVARVRTYAVFSEDRSVLQWSTANYIYI